MKLFGKLLIAVLIIGILLPFTVLKGKDGKPLMSFGDIKMPNISLPDLPDTPKLGGDNKSVSADGKDLIYKWTDSEGNLQFSTSPPPEGVEFTVKGYDPDTNLIQAVEVSTEIPEDEAKQPEAKKPVTPPDGIGSVYSPEAIEKLFEDAKNVEKLLNERIKNQEAIAGQ